MVRHIGEDADWLLNMVENLLTVTRISEGRASVNKSLEPVEEVMSEAVFRLKKEFRTRTYGCCFRRNSS